MAGATSDWSHCWVKPLLSEATSGWGHCCTARRLVTKGALSWGLPRATHGWTNPPIKLFYEMPVNERCLEGRVAMLSPPPLGCQAVVAEWHVWTWTACLIGRQYILLLLFRREQYARLHGHARKELAAPYMSWIFLVLVGFDPGVSRLEGEMVSHYATDALLIINVKCGYHCNDNINAFATAVLRCWSTTRQAWVATIGLIPPPINLFYDISVNVRSLKTRS